MRFLIQIREGAIVDRLLERSATNRRTPQDEAAVILEGVLSEPDRGLCRPPGEDGASVRVADDG